MTRPTRSRPGAAARRTTTRATRSRARARLAVEIGGRVPEPLDAFEIAAVLESIGVTDAVAREDFGATDVFELAEDLLPVVVAQASRAPVADEPASELAAVAAEPVATAESAGRGLLALAPLAFLILVMQGLGAAGWTTSATLALALGITAAMLATSGPILAIGRRTSTYFGFDYRTPAMRFLGFTSLMAAAACLVAGVAFVGVTSGAGLLSLQERLMAFVGLVAGGSLWLLMASLTLAGFSLAAVAGLAVGLALGAGVGVAVGSPAGLAVAWATSAVVLLLVWRHAYRRDPSPRLRFPSPSLLALEAVPYVVFGTVFALVLFEPYLLGWVGSTTETQASALATLSLSLTLALLPVLFASGMNERIMSSFWKYSKLAQKGTDAREFSRSLVGFHDSRHRRFALALGALSCVVLLAVELTIALGGLRSASQLVFLMGIVGCFLLGLGQYSCFFMLGLGRPRPALGAIVAGAVAVTAIAVPLTFVDFRLVAPAFAAGAAVFALIARKTCRRSLHDADYHYAATF